MLGVFVSFAMRISDGFDPRVLQFRDTNYLHVVRNG